MDSKSTFAINVESNPDLLDADYYDHDESSADMNTTIPIETIQSLENVENVEILNASESLEAIEKAQSEIGFSSSDEQDSSDDSSSESSISEEEDGQILIEEEEEFVQNSILKTKNEVDALPPLEDIIMDIPKHLPLTCIGKVKAIVEKMIIVEADSQIHQVLDIDSIILNDNYQIVGKIFDVFGPVTDPLYSIRFNDESQLENLNLKPDTLLYFISNLVKMVATEALKSLKGTDASNQYDEEIGEEEMEFSDDEKEAEYKRLKKLKSNGVNTPNSSSSAPSKNKKNTNKRVRQNYNLDHNSVNQTHHHHQQLPSSSMNAQYSQYSQYAQMGSPSIPQMDPSHYYYQQQMMYQQQWMYYNQYAQGSMTNNNPIYYPYYSPPNVPQGYPNPTVKPPNEDLNKK